MGFISKGSMLGSTLARESRRAELGRPGCLHALCTGGLPCSSPRGTWLSRSLTAAVCAQGPASNTQFNTCKCAYFRNLVFKKNGIKFKKYVSTIAPDSLSTEERGCFLKHAESTNEPFSSLPCLSKKGALIFHLVQCACDPAFSC